MQYPKPLMKISELEKLGYSKAILREWAHVRGAPIRRNGKLGTIFYDTERLPDFEKKMSRI